jgi:hypothetical protein
MGADYPGQERAIEILRALPPECREFLGHHINNALSSVIGGIRTKQYDLAEKAAWHINEDLKLIGINKFRRG